MAINALVEQMCEGVGFVDLWGYFVGKEDMYVRDGLHLSGKGAVVFSENLLRSIYEQWNRLQLFKLDSQGDSQRSQILEAQIRTAKRNQQRTVWKTLQHLVINVFV